MKNQTYNIIRYFAARGKPAQVMQTGLTLEQAQAHCQRDDTCVPSVYFDAFRKVGGTEKTDSQAWLGKALGWRVSR